MPFATPRFLRGWPLLVLPLLSAAAPLGDEAPDALIRRANAAFDNGDLPSAEALYAAAAERTGDPGLVAFNRAAILFQKGDFAAAEAEYARTLEDRACPPERAARAWFNRGTCLLRRGGSAAVFRSAVACFERCRELGSAEESLLADARFNLELAKQLWAEANRKAAQPDNPGTPPEADQPDPTPPKPPGNDADPKPPENSNSTQSNDPRQQPMPGTGTPDMPLPPGTQPTPGNNPLLQPLLDADALQPMSAEATREYLRRADTRLREERRRMIRMMYTPDRPGVRDW